MCCKLRVRVWECRQILWYNQFSRTRLDGGGDSLTITNHQQVLTIIPSSTSYLSFSDDVSKAVKFLPRLQPSLIRLAAMHDFSNCSNGNIFTLLYWRLASSSAVEIDGSGVLARPLWKVWQYRAWHLKGNGGNLAIFWNYQQRTEEVLYE